MCFLTFKLRRRSVCNAKAAAVLSSERLVYVPQDACLDAREAGLKALSHL